MSSSRVTEFLSTIPLITKALLIVNVSIHVLNFVMSLNVANYSEIPFMVINRYEYYRIVTFCFLHGGIMRLRPQGLRMLGRPADGVWHFPRCWHFFLHSHWMTPVTVRAAGNDDNVLQLQIPRTR